MKEKEVKKVEEVDKEVFTFFVLAFPTILIVILGMVAPRLWWVNIILAIFQFIVLKQVLGNYYKIWES